MACFAGEIRVRTGVICIPDFVLAAAAYNGNTAHAAPRIDRLKGNAFQRLGCKNAEIRKALLPHVSDSSERQKRRSIFNPQLFAERIVDSALRNVEAGVERCDRKSVFDAFYDPSRGAVARKA